MINKEDIVVLKDLFLNKEEVATCHLIANNTVNTWQANRSDEDKIRDTYLGKFAEKAIKCFLNKENENNSYVSFYDDFRIDNFKYHNSIDFIFSKNSKKLIGAQNFIKENLSQKNSKLNIEQRNRFKASNVNIGEIKATRILDRFIRNNSVDLNLILNDDFLTYPYFTRKSSLNNTNEYIQNFMEKNKLSKEELLQKENSVLADFYFRVYIKENLEDNSKCDAYIIGCLPGFEFINNFNIKKMFKNNKSEAALYLSVPLKNGITINNFKNAYLPNQIKDSLILK